jgi:tRNA (cytidine/uridine-2'-O-)-methyltransferase
MNPERHVVLIHPEIHWNTGNIGRTCLGAGARLHLVKPLGFSLDDRMVKRAGLDYWHLVDPFVWDDFDGFADSMKIKPEETVLLTKTGRKSFREMPPSNRLFLIFGSETLGLPAEISSRYDSSSTYHIPITRQIRSLNLSTAVAVVLYESIRDFDNFHDWGERL